MLVNELLLEKQTKNVKDLVVNITAQVHSIISTHSALQEGHTIESSHDDRMSVKALNGWSHEASSALQRHCRSMMTTSAQLLCSQTKRRILILEANKMPEWTGVLGLHGLEAIVIVLTPEHLREEIIEKCYAVLIISHRLLLCVCNFCLWTKNCAAHECVHKHVDQVMCASVPGRIDRRTPPEKSS